MPAMSRFRTLMISIRNIVSGERRRGSKKKEAERKAILAARLKACDTSLADTLAVVAKVPVERRMELNSKYQALQNDYKILTTKIDPELDEFDIRLEVLLLHSRTLKLIAECENAIASTKYNDQEKSNLHGLLEEIADLNSAELYNESTSHEIVEYRTKLENLETKVISHLHDAINFS